MKKEIRLITTVFLILLMAIPALAEIRRGSSGEDVKEIQQRLLDLGYLDDVVDGKFGQKTESALKAFQEANGIEATGVATIRVINLLFSDYAIDSSGNSIASSTISNNRLPQSPTEEREDQQSAENGTISDLFEKKQGSFEGEITNANDSESNMINETVTIKEYGFQLHNGRLRYAYIAHNNLSDKAIYLPQFRIIARNAEGELVFTDTETLMYIYPNQDTVHSGRSGKLDDIPTEIEIQFVDPVNDWHIVNPSTLKQAKYIPFEVKNTKLKEKSVIGEMYNPNDYDQSTIAVTILFRDSEGNLLSGQTSFVRDVKRGETVPFEITFDKNLKTDYYDVFAQPW